MLPKLTRGQKRRIRLAVVLSCGVLGTVAAIGADIYRFGLTRDSLPADAAIVLGAAAWGEEPSPVFAERIKHAIDLYHAGRVRYLIFTGGVGAQNPLAESVVAGRYAVAHGVDPDDTWCEMTSRITWENLRGAKQIVDQQYLNRVLVVSDPLHMRRAMAMARDLGLAAYSSPTPTTRYIGFKSQAAFLRREIYFYSLYLLQRPFVPLRQAPAMAVQPCPMVQNPSSSNP